MPNVAECKFERGGWLQVYQLRERAGGGSCTLAVVFFLIPHSPPLPWTGYAVASAFRHPHF